MNNSVENAILICPSCHSRDIIISVEKCECSFCGKEFKKGNAKRALKFTKELPDALYNIATVKTGGVANKKACPVCGSSRILSARREGADKKMMRCDRCHRKFHPEELIRFGEKPLMKLEDLKRVRV